MLNLNEIDRKWVDALKPYYGGGTVPLYHNPDGTVDASRTIQRFAESHDVQPLQQPAAPGA